MAKEKIYGMRETIKEVLIKMKMLSPAAEELIYMTCMAE